GLFHLPLAYMWIAIASMPTAMIHLNAIERWGARKTRTRIFFITAITLLFFVPFVDQNQRPMMTAMFIVVPTIFAAIFAGHSCCYHLHSWVHQVLFRFG
ncbi:MAG: hypothetical protein JSW07_04775, partial [bacterium]